MKQTIEAPNEEDVDRIAHQIIHANLLVEQVMRQSLTCQLTDLDLIQSVLDQKIIKPEATYSLQAIGVAFGKIFINNNSSYDWWMVEDEYGRDPAIRYKETTLLAFPQTMISKRIEDGETVEVRRMYEGLIHQLDEIRRKNYPDA